ncbi:MAG TPA: lysophospholipid acyltransferase family protein [Pseudolabrys sp.]|nr:lysophospholipid acyltransferase family protein [Pseudolabrys sp.]
MFSIKRFTRSPIFQELLGTLGAWYLRFVWLTSRPVVETEAMSIYEMTDMPAIIAAWHGQHFLMPFVRDAERHRVKVLISRHRDGEINARVAEKLGIETIRGSGAHNGEFHRKGGAAAFNAMLEALRDGYNVALTADVPKVSRIAGLGLVKLAQHSGRPIYLVAIASSRRIELDNWDRSAINLPFSRLGIAATGPITVPLDAEGAELEDIRRHIQDELNRLTHRAYEIADKTGSRAT